MATSTQALRKAILLSIGAELTTGSTRDTNAGDLAARLSALGVDVLSMTALPDRLDAVTDAFSTALDRADLVVSTGGLGPTPDDLTREAIAAACGATPTVDPALEAWLRGLFERRGLSMPDGNLKQAWLIPGAEGLPNHHGTAPGWWVDTRERVIVALPGPPREMWPMWTEQVLPRLRERGVGQEVASETLRLAGIGESALADLIGEEILRAPDPEVATYARLDAVDVRIHALGPGAHDRVAAMTAHLERLLRRWIFGRGDASWTDVLGERMAGRSLAVVEVGTAGQLGSLLGGTPWFRRGETLTPPAGDAATSDDARSWLRSEALRVREAAGAEVGLAVQAREGASDTEVTVAVAMGERLTERTSTAFLTGVEGRRRAALAACAELWQRLGDEREEVSDRVEPDPP